MIDRALLALLSTQPVSGVLLAERLNISRSAVWKRIQQLRDAGFEIETKSGEGYFLKHPVEWLDQKYICNALNPSAKNLLGGFYIT